MMAVAIMERGSVQLAFRSSSERCTLESAPITGASPKSTTKSFLWLSRERELTIAHRCTDANQRSDTRTRPAVAFEGREHRYVASRRHDPTH